MKPADKPSARRTQAERRGDAEQRLLQAAREIVARKGWSGMTLSEVGEAAGYSRGLAAHHFGSKAGLVQKLAAYVNSNFMDLVQEEAPTWRPGLGALKGFVGVYLGRNESDWVNSRALLSLMAEAVTQNSETAQILAQYNRSVQQLLADCISEGIANGEIRGDVQPAASAVLILGALRGSMLQFLLDPGRIDLAALQRQLLDFIETALAA